MKAIISWFLIVFLTGCQTGVPCPKNMNRPGETCCVLYIPHSDPIMNTMGLIVAIKEYRDSTKKKGEKDSVVKKGMLLN